MCVLYYYELAIVINFGSITEIIKHTPRITIVLAEKLVLKAAFLV